ncbi:cadherin-related family member 3 [Ambystoma mexicanum]|uniref:cadherin-related family member 3 n=1 Tax=Ambystoma mexicanum TaxID=8296 RepID=UPI0037E72279
MAPGVSQSFERSLGYTTLNFSSPRFLGKTCVGSLQFVGLPGAVNVSENAAAGSRVFTFTVTPASSVLQYGFPYIINSDPLTKAFRIDASSGVYTVVTTGNPTLDYETAPNSFNLQIYAKDTNGFTDLKILSIQLLDVNEPPIFLDNMQTQDVVIYINEGTAVGMVYQIQASDPESTKSTLRYSLAPASAPFSVSTTGSVSPTKVLNYETDPHSYTLNIGVSDPQGLFVNGTLIININNINDEFPYFTTTQTVYNIPEEQNPGTIVANVTAQDPDSVGFLGSLVYSIKTPNVYFTINPNTGVIQIARTIDREADPFRLNPSISLLIGVQDSPEPVHTNQTLLTFIIGDLNDNPPTCEQYAFSVSIPETEAVGALIFDARDAGKCKDIDVEAPNNLFNFTGLAGLGTNQRFNMVPAGSGTIMLNGDLNFEDPNNIAVGNEYTLTVRMQDIAFPYYTKFLYIYVKTLPVNEFPPVFNSTSYTFNVSELSPPSSKIGQVYATDKDYPFIGITYSIVQGGSTLGSSDIFWIDPSTGNIQLITFTDYETTPKYIFVVQAADPGLKISTASVTVNIIEANDEKPICVPNSYSLSVPVTQAVGTNIQNFKLLCTDRDSGPTSFRYFINSGNINNHFTFSPSAGTNVTRLTLGAQFDYTNGLDQVWDYKLLVYITDDNLLGAATRASTGLIQTGTVTLNIHVFIPGLTTVITTTTPSVTYVTRKENVFSPAAWYVPFVIALGCCLLLGLLGYLAYVLSRCIRCPPRTKADTEPLIENIEKKKNIKQDVIWEMTKLNTVFDGEATDPITGKVYEYNSKSGARRWKDTKQMIEPARVEPVVQKAPTPAGKTAEGKGRSGTPQKTEPGAAGTDQKPAQEMGPPKPHEGSTEAAGPETTKPSEMRASRSPLSLHRSPLPPRKITPQLP